MTADYVFTVSITADRSLNEARHDALAEAVDAANLEGAINDAVIEALNAALPHADLDWYVLKVERTT